MGIYQVTRQQGKHPPLATISLWEHLFSGGQNGPIDM